MQSSATSRADITLDSDFLRDPHPVYVRLREEAPAHEVTLPTGMKVWLVTRYDEGRAVLADPLLSKDFRDVGDLFQRHQPDPNQRRQFTNEISQHMLNSDQPDHTRLRRLVGKAFTSRRIEQLRPRIEEISDELLDGLAGRTEFDLVDDFAFPLPLTVICELLGIPQADRDNFRAWSNTLVSTSGREEIQQAAIAMTAYLVTLMAEKRTSPADDMLTALLDSRDDKDTLSEGELLSMVFLLLVAGHETTVNLIGNGMLALLVNPDQLAALRADSALLPGAVEEFLRFESPVNMTTLRYTTAPVRVGDVTVPADEFVLVALSSANRDPERFDDPDRLDVTRPAGGHLAFGHGIHYCLGAPLARLEGEIAFERLLHRFPDLRLAVDPGQLRWRPSTLIRGVENLPVTVR